MQVLLSALCMGLTSAVIGNAFYQKQQFYPAVVYITKSNASMAVVYVQFFVIVFMFGKLLRKIFLGTLRPAEFEHLLERFWYALTETCLAFTVFRDDFNPRFVALFTVLLFLKSFHWLAEERVDFMERSPVLGWLFHIRVASLLFVLASLDYMLLIHAYNSTLVRGPTVQLVFGFEYAILLTVVTSIAIKYVLHAAEMQADTPWENKAVILLYTELVIGLIKVILYVLFVVIMARIYALPMFVFRPMFFTIRNFKKALSDVIMSRRAIRNMNTLYPDATPEELRLSDNICIICREDMINNSKKLPCGHIFHTTCLRSWFQRQQTCPTCRLNILRTPARNSTAVPHVAEQPAAAAAGAAVPQAAANAAPNLRDTDVPTARFEGVAGAGPSPAPNVVPNFVPPLVPPFMMPTPFPFIAPYAVAPPPMPPDLQNLSLEELQAMEGNERHHIEERIKLLNNIKLMLDAASILMNNYQLIAARYPLPPNAAASAADATAREPAATTSSGAGKISTTDTTKTNSNSTKEFADSSLNEQPSTSAAAAAAVNKSNDIDVRASSSTKRVPAEVAATTITKGTNELNKNHVTIEDLGVEEHIDAVPAKETKIQTESNDFENGTEMTELRKRRLKYLQELSKTTTPHE